MSNINTDYNFRFWKYVRLHANLIEKQLTNEICVNSDIIITIDNRQYIKKKISEIVEQKTVKLIRVKKIKAI